MSTTSNYQTELNAILREHFDADDIPCDDFTAIAQAYAEGKSLTAAEVHASIVSVIDEDDCGPLPPALMDAVREWLTGRSAKGKGKTSKVTKKKAAVSDTPAAVIPVDKKAATAIPAAAAPVLPAVAAPAVLPAPPVKAVEEKKSVVKKGKKASEAAAAPAVVAPVAPAAVAPAVVAPIAAVVPAAVEAEAAPVKQMNHVARFSQMVSYVNNPGVHAAALASLLQASIVLEDGFNRASPLFGTLSTTTDLMAQVGRTVTFQELTGLIRAALPKPAVVTIAAIVRWFVPAARREALTAQFVALALPLPVKKAVKRRAKTPPATGAEAPPAKRAKRVKKDPSERRPAQGYSLFTQRIGGVLKGTEAAYGATEIVVQDNFSEATKAKPVGGYARYTGLLADGRLKAGTGYTIETLTGLATASAETKSSVVSVSGLIWGMCDATTRLRLTEGGDKSPPAPPLGGI